MATTTQDPMEEVRELVRLVRSQQDRIADLKLKGYGDEQTRLLTEDLQVTVQKLRRMLANLNNYIPSLEAYASGLAELPTDIDTLIEQRILAEVTLDDRFIRTVQKLGGARSWGAWLGRHIAVIVALIVTGTLGGLLIYRLTEPEQFAELTQAIGNISWWQASVVVLAVGAIGAVAFFAWRQRRRQHKLGQGEVVTS